MKTINVMMASLAALLVAACSQNEVTEGSSECTQEHRPVE